MWGIRRSAPVVCLPLFGFPHSNTPDLRTKPTRDLFTEFNAGWTHGSKGGTMSVMPVNSILTREDLDALPDDGRRHELIDGAFVMSPSPGMGHHDVGAALVRVLWAATRGTNLKVVSAPFDVALGQHVVVPDLLIAPEGNFTDRDLPVAPLLAVEIRSPSTVWLDEGRKRTLYEEAGVASCWLLDPAIPSIRILELVDGRYVEIAHAVGDQTIEVTAPVTITLNPAELARG